MFAEVSDVGGTRDLADPRREMLEHGLVLGPLEGRAPPAHNR
jgi:hypothetical protein